MKILNDDDAKIVKAMIGETIVDAIWADVNPDSDWLDHGCLIFRLSNGRTIRFGSMGYDASDITVEVVTGLKELAEIDALRSET